VRDSMSPTSEACLDNDWFPSRPEMDRGLRLFFAHVSHWIPCIHEATFDESSCPLYLLLAMLCVAYQHDDLAAPPEHSQSQDISLRCFYRSRLLASLVEDGSEDPHTCMTLVQTYLLLQICAMFYLCGSHSTSGLKMHAKMVSLVRLGGLTTPIPPDDLGAEDLDSL
jgi:hypothetical protein